jgi:phenylpyruvate tautomerase PptA (4-oxalocrotonate tautomerase family)
MPLLEIKMLEGRSAVEKTALLNAVHSAIVETLQTTLSKHNQRIREFSQAEFMCPTGKTDKFTFVEITLFRDNSRETKQRLYREVIHRLVQLGVPTDDVYVVIHDRSLSAWVNPAGDLTNELGLG